MVGVWSDTEVLLCVWERAAQAAITDNSAIRSEIQHLCNGNHLLETAIVLFCTSSALLEPVSLKLV